MRLIFSTPHWKFHVYTKNAKKVSQKVSGFFDNVIWGGNGKLSLLLREYSRLTVRLLTSSTKIWDLSKKKKFLTQFGSEWWKSRIKILFWRLQECLEIVNTFTAKGFSERSPVIHLTKHLFRSRSSQKYLT